MNLVILGPQGCGKGTQAGMLAQKFHLENIDMGKFLREVASTDTAVGKEIYHIQNVTKTLVPSRILKEVLHLKLGSIPREQGIVFDGVPRTMDQAQYFIEALREFGRNIDHLFFINISPEESVRRISNRWTCEKCRRALIMGSDVKSDGDSCPGCGGKIIQRIDDTPEGIKKRLEVFKKETMPVVEFLKGKTDVVEINGEQPEEIVFEEIIKHIEKE